MGKIKKILENELVGGTQTTDVYPVTSTKAVYDTNNKVLDDYIQHLKKTSTFAGIATPTTNPGTPDGPVFYIAGEGTYANFSNIVIEAGQLGILKWNGTWSKEVLEIGAGGGSGGNGSGSGVSLGTLLAQLNNENPFPTDNGQVLTYDGSNFVWKIPTGSGGSSSSSNYPLTIYNGSSNTDYITYDGSSAAYLRFKSGFSISKTGLGYEISASGGSGVALSEVMSAMNDQLDKTSYGTPQFLYWDGSTYTWKNESEISGGSGGSTSTSVSWENVTNKPSTFTPSSHTHKTSDISGLSSYVQGITVDNAKKATQLANSRTIWGQSFNGTSNINGNLYMGTAGGDSIQLWMNNGNMLDRTNNTLHIGNGLKESSNGEINLDAYATKVYTDNMNKHYDFKSNVFDVNSNQIHFGSETNGGKIYWDAANNAFKIEGNVYATGGITALGVSNNATTSNNVDFTFRSVTSPTYKFNNGSYLTETSTDINSEILKLYHAGSNQYILLNNEYENIAGDHFLGSTIDSSCMSFMNADWYYFDNSLVVPEIYTKKITFYDRDGNQSGILNDISISKVSSQTRLVFTINDIQYYVNAN